MYLKEYLEQFGDSKIRMFVDMDGVMADYIVGDAANYDKKRPLFSSIEKLSEVAKMNNIELYILSVTRMDEGIEQKNEWLDKYANFFKKENRVIISRESNDFKSSSELKSKFIQALERDESKIVVIDDDPRILFAIKDTSEDVILLKDTVLVD
ncbi:MAG: hypothetical protein IKD76_05235 [Clostridia bacterium]|nr:hypothetical protein [Clostridia bacterium]